MGKVVNIKNTDKKNKPNNPLVMKVMIVTLVLLAILKLPELIDDRPPVFKDHEVYLFKTPIEIPKDYTVFDLSSRSVKLTDMLGSELTLLPFWATWCGYCAAEMPVMDDVTPYLAKHGVEIIPIARGDDTPNKVVEFFEHGKIKNLASVIASTPELHKALGVKGYPSYIAVNSNGMAFAKLRPQWNSDDILKLFEELRATESKKGY